MPSIIHLGAAATELATFDALKDADARAGAGGNRATNRPAIAVASFNDDRMSGKPTSVRASRSTASGAGSSAKRLASC
jgi:hypothetical protein